MNFDVIVLAGGRSSRLGGIAKAELTIGGQSLLESTLAAVTGSSRRVVVGVANELPVDVLLTREIPEFAGPAAAIAEGFAVLQEAPGVGAEFTLVLACDMPGVGVAVQHLLRSVVESGAGTHGAAVIDGAVAIDGQGRRQHLVGLYRTGSLRTAVALNARRLQNLAVRAMFDTLDLRDVAVPLGSTGDIDTWADAARFGIRKAQHSESHQTGTRGVAMATDEVAHTETIAILTNWSRRLCDELGLGELEVDIDAVLLLAGVAAHAVLRPAAPLTTYLVGYAAGLTAAAGGVSARDAFVRSADIARMSAEAQAETTPETHQ